MAKCVKGSKNAHISKGQKLTHSPAREEKRNRRHHYTTLTNASTSLQRQDEHNRTQSLLGLLILTPTHATGWPGQRSLEPNWLPCEITREHSAAGKLWPARVAQTRFSDRAWREGVPCPQRVIRVVHEEAVL